MGRSFGETIPQGITQTHTRSQMQPDTLKNKRRVMEILPSVDISYITQSRSHPFAETPQTCSSAMETIQEPLTTGPKLMSRMSIPKTDISLHWPLMDPFLQDLDPNSRYYVFHFANKICNDLVIYEQASQNPIRDLIPAGKEHPVLLNIIIANSAYHIFNLYCESASWQPPKSPIKPLNLYEGQGQDVYKDALTAKQNALRLLNDSLANICSNDFDILLASILLFINFELIESGKDSWRVHVEGANRLIGWLNTSSSINSLQTETSKASPLRMTLMSDCLVYSILGSILTHSRLPVMPPSHFIEIDSVLEYAERNNYLSCPGELLRILLAASELSHTTNAAMSSQEVSEERYEEQALFYLRAAESFNPRAWAESSQDLSPLPDIEERVHVVSALKAAVCISIVRALPCTLPLLSPSISGSYVGVADLVSSIIYHLSFITSDIILFKATSWPTFLAGAESEDFEQRAWVVGRLNALWEKLRWGYIRSALDLLGLIWDKKGRRMSNPQHSSSWIQEVKSLNTDLLIV